MNFKNLDEIKLKRVVFFIPGQVDPEHLEVEFDDLKVGSKLYIGTTGAEKEKGVNFEVKEIKIVDLEVIIVCEKFQHLYTIYDLIKNLPDQMEFIDLSEVDKEKKVKTVKELKEEYVDNTNCDYYMYENKSRNKKPVKSIVSNFFKFSIYRQKTN